MKLFSKFALLATLLLAGTTVSAQRQYEPHFWAGGRGGVTMSKQNLYPSVPQSMITGITAGAILRYIEEKHFGLQVELNLEQRGWKEKFENEPFEFSRRFTYIQLPILTHITFGSNTKVFFNAGPELGLMIGEKTTSNFDLNNTSSTDNYPQNRATAQYTLAVKNKFDYGISGGCGVELPLGNNNYIFAEGRFYYGLQDVFGNKKTDDFSGSNGMSIMLTAGYMFRLK
ncbi:MAG: PorT family protein [Muribaculaceae bacterium]|nr:PorT family protein [Muribaculaceae bacterium]